MGTTRPEAGPIRRALWALPVAVALATSGCGAPRTIPLSGRLLRGEKPFTAAEGQALGLTFVAAEAIKDPSSGTVLAAEGEPFPADIRPDDGTFRVPGREGRGIPPGKYRVTVYLRQREAPANAPSRPGGAKFDRDKDLLGGRFDATKSPIVREITDSTALTIDLDKPTG
jgi:hypothetical protein